MKKNIAALLACVMVVAAAAPAMAAYRTGSAVGDTVAYGTGGALVGGGAFAAVTWLFSVACPPAALVSAAVVGGTYLGWYGATDENKTFKKDVEKIAQTGALGVAAGLGAKELIENKTALQTAY